MAAKLNVMPRLALGSYTRQSDRDILPESYRGAYTLSATGEFIWSFVSTGVTMEAIAQSMAERSGLGPAEAVTHAAAFVDQLRPCEFVNVDAPE